MRILELDHRERTCNGAGCDVDVEGDAAGRAPVDAVLQRQLDLGGQEESSSFVS